ncbi:tumor necrosis factor receptor superfamily member 6B-like isoform X2 [Betta splendens]|uniref:Tumor necrosis factor receptor superfamily member 6B-like isoform X2 n=1 Tax=Betta splendens TaxID=158456 RepID=A0A6P7NUV3_BETSP|nr:tumor necrosis factor receptor superfamily member 6B-like isoform X2 [Betta splendens]
MMFASLLSTSLFAVLSFTHARQTYRTTDPSTGETRECERCPPGTYLRQSCTSTRGSQCAPCPDGSFTELWNYIPKCLRCGACGHNQVVKTECAPDADCTCECKKGYYYKESYDACVAHRTCAAGEGVLTEGSPHNDTVCQVCPSGTFSTSVSAQDKCEPHQNCEAPELKLLLRGSNWHDSMCVNCDGLRSTDGADYLRELLPAFFLHHNINSRRLRRILHRLPGARPSDASGPHLSLWERLGAWAASASAPQIRLLPEVLSKAGADAAGERLLHKLQRMDAGLQRCSARNEVEAEAF